MDRMEGLDKQWMVMDTEQQMVVKGKSVQGLAVQVVLHMVVQMEHSSLLLYWHLNNAI